MIQVTANVYVETGIPACNIGFVTTKEGIVAIDTPIRASAAMNWRDEVSKKGEVRYLVNTEEHPDHYHGTWFFPGVLISHQETRKTLSEEPHDVFIERAKRVDPEGVALAQGYRLRLADITFTENLNIYLGDHTFKLLHLPGHSPGGTGVYIPEERTVFTTDIVFHKRKSWLHESDPSQWLESIKKLSELDVDIVVPGHGDICKKDYLDEQAEIIRSWVGVVQSAIEKGLSEEEATATIKQPDPHPKQPGTPHTEDELNKLIIARLYHLYSK